MFKFSLQVRTEHCYFGFFMKAMIFIDKTILLFYKEKRLLDFRKINKEKASEEGCSTDQVLGKYDNF